MASWRGRMWCSRVGGDHQMQRWTAINNSHILIGFGCICCTVLKLGCVCNGILLIIKPCKWNVTMLIFHINEPGNTKFSIWHNLLILKKFSVCVCVCVCMYVCTFQASHKIFCNSQCGSWCAVAAFQVKILAGAWIYVYIFVRYVIMYCGFIFTWTVNHEQFC